MIMVATMKMRNMNIEALNTGMGCLGSSPQGGSEEGRERRKNTTIIIVMSIISWCSFCR